MRLNRIRIGGALIAATAIMFAGAEQASAQVNMTGSWALEVTSDADGAELPPGKARKAVVPLSSCRKPNSPTPSLS